MQARAASVFLGEQMGWQQKIVKQIAERVLNTSLQYNIQKMLYKLDWENGIKSKIERIGETDAIHLVLTDLDKKKSVEHYFSFKNLCAMKSRWEVLDHVKKEYFRLRDLIKI